MLEIDGGDRLQVTAPTEADWSETPKMTLLVKATL